MTPLASEAKQGHNSCPNLHFHPDTEEDSRLHAAVSSPNTVYPNSQVEQTILSRRPCTPHSSLLQYNDNAPRTPTPTPTQPPTPTAAATKTASPRHATPRHACAHLPRAPHTPPTPYYTVSSIVGPPAAPPSGGESRQSRVPTSTTRVPPPCLCAILNTIRLISS